MSKALVRVLPHGPRTPMWTYGGTFPGPTIVRPTGRDTRVTFVNRPAPPGRPDDDPPARRTPEVVRRRPADSLPDPARSAADLRLPVDRRRLPLPAALRFYHDHRMDRTARNNWMGLQGLFLTTDPSDARRGLPHGRFDLPLMVTDRSFRPDNRLRNPFHHGMSMPMSSPTSRMHGPTHAHHGAMGPASGTVGSKVLVNGRFAPYKKVEPGRYRLQILNASLFSSYDFALSDGRPFVQIGTGSGLLPHPVTRQDILLGPAQRADVVVDFRGEAGKGILLVLRQAHRRLHHRHRLTGGGADEVPGPRHEPPEGADPVPARPRQDDPHVPRRVAMTWTFGISKDRHGTFWSINDKRVRPDAGSTTA